MIKNIFEVNSRGQPTSASVDINRFFAWIIAGPSGSGKSTFLRRLLGLISFYDTDAEAYFLDFKADEEMFPMIGDHVARGFYCLELFETVCQRFEARLNKQEENSHNLYLIFAHDSESSLPNRARQTHAYHAFESETLQLISKV